jgi:S-layer homology domain.
VSAAPVAPSTGGGSGGGTPSATTTTAKKEEHAPYMIGDNLGKFNPDGNMTRAEMAQMLYNLLDNSTKSTSSKSFSDVSVGDWYYEAVTALSAKGIINGYVDGTFRPDAAMTRSEFTALMVRFVESVTGKALTLGNKAFADVSADHWASEYVAAMSAVVGMTGYDAAFKPEQSITRAEVAEAANAMLDRVPDKKYIDSNPAVNKFPDVSADHWAYYEIMEASAKHGHTDAGAWIVG